MKKSDAPRKYRLEEICLHVLKSQRFRNRQVINAGQLNTLVYAIRALTKQLERL